MLACVGILAVGIDRLPLHFIENASRLTLFGFNDLCLVAPWLTTVKKPQASSGLGLGFVAVGGIARLDYRGEEYAGISGLRRG